jgi:hypothetical protein
VILRANSTRTAKDRHSGVVGATAHTLCLRHMALQALVKTTETHLAGVWDALGTDAARREELLAKLHADLEAVLERATQEADEEQKRTEAQRETCFETIKTLAESMEVEEEAPEPVPTEGVYQHVTALQGRIHELDSLKNERSSELTKLHVAIHGLFSDLGMAAEVSGWQPPIVRSGRLTLRGAGTVFCGRGQAHNEPCAPIRESYRRTRD